MENGSRALLMAATVLLGIFLLSIMIYMFRAGGRVSKAYDDKQINQQLEAHNGKFEYFDSNKNTITDVISLANLVYSTNEEGEYNNGYAVDLEIDCEGTTYSVPNEKKLTDRNTILEDGTVIEIYKLLNTPLKDLIGKESVSKWGGGNNGTVNSGETLSQTRLDANNRRIYKYIFVRDSDDGFTYYEGTGRVESIKLKLYINPEY